MRRWLLVALLLSPWHTTAQEAGRETGGGTSGIPVQVIEAEAGTLNATRVTSVVIEPARESSVAAATSGRVLQVLTREDVPVAADEPVVVLDTSALELRRENAQLAIDSADVSLQEASQANQEEQAQARSQVRTAEASLRLAQQRYQRGAGAVRDRSPLRGRADPARG